MPLVGADGPTRRWMVQASVVLAGSGLVRPGKVAARTNDTKPAWMTLPPTPTLPVATRSGLAAVNGTQIFFAQFGDQAAPSVLLLHGGMGSSNYWGHQVGHLAKRVSVTVMDTRGHGRSPVTSRDFGYRVFARDVVGVLDHLKIARTAIVGWSDGAVTGLELAMRHPDRVSRLFAFGANSTVDGTIANGGRSRTFVAYGNRCRQEYATLSPSPDKWPQLMAGLGHMWRTEPNFSKTDLAAVKVPTTVSDGEHDEVIKRSDTERMAHGIPGAKLVILSGVSHFAMLQDPQGFNAAIDAFL